MVQWLGTFFLKLTGWKVAGTYHREIKKYIIVVGPHTSNWDFFIAVAVRASLQIKSYYLAKKEILEF
ncbi:MAG: glycerol acyltransferase, partial [Cyclobacteriaceae bacterium]|nr:glycerol acyltransferase [Cyclobacteriaceae bacterium]